MPEEIRTIVKIPLSEIAESIKEKHNLTSKLKDAQIEGDSLLLHFVEEEQEAEQEILQVLPNIQKSRRKRRRPRKKRNRMKTRGWQVVARITNSKGQKCSIYKPFVDAFENQQLTAEEQRKKVESILRANKNKPSEGSIQYFLENTLEYLQKRTNLINIVPGGGRSDTAKP
jgi:hypothetical protein